MSFRWHVFDIIDLIIARLGFGGWPGKGHKPPRPDELGVVDAIDDHASTREETPLTVDVLANDQVSGIKSWCHAHRHTRPDRDDLTIVGVTDGQNGTVTVNPDNTVTYTPDPDFSGSDTFTYTISNGDDATDIRHAAKGTKGGKIVSLSLTYDPGDTIDQDQQQGRWHAKLNGDADDDGTAYVLISSRGNLHRLREKDILFQGEVAAGETIEASTAKGGSLRWKTFVFVYESEAAFEAGDGPLQVAKFNTSGSKPLSIGDVFGSVSIAGATLKNGRALGVDGQDTATVKVEVLPANDLPTANDDSYSVAAGSTLSVPAADGVLQNDSDPDNDDLVADLVSDTGNGTVTLLSDGSFSYTPDPGFFGTDGFSYAAIDEQGGRDTAEVEIVVTPAPRSYSLAWDTDTVVEGDSGRTAVTYTLSRDRAGATTTVELSFTGTATNGVDYIGTTTRVFGVNDLTLTGQQILVNGDTQLEPDETVGLAIASVNDGGTFDPQAQVLTIQNDDQPRTYSLAWDSDTVAEGNTGQTVVNYAISRDRAGSTTTVELSFAGTATNGPDYTGGTTIGFGVGDLTVTGLIRVNGDTEAEPDETVELAIASVGDGGTFDRQGQVLTIQDDDGPRAYSLAWDSDTVVEGDSGQTAVTYTLSRDRAEATTTVGLSFAGTATNGLDYAGDTVARFGFGNLTATGQILVNGDTEVEPDETVELAIVNVNDGGTFDPQAQVLTIQDDDQPRVYSLAWNIDTVVEGDSGQTAVTFTLTRDRADAATTVGLSFGGSATNGLDYSGSTTQVFGFDDLTLIGQILINGDTTAELDETVELSIVNVNDGGTFSSQADILTILDDDTTSVLTGATMFDDLWG